MADIDIGKILEALNGKADTDLNNTQAFKKTGGELLGNILRNRVLARSPSETELMIKAGSSTTNEDGALFVVYGKNGVSPGQFLARACSANGTMYDLRGAPNGSLQWGGKDIVRQQGVSKGSSSGYIKLNSGIIIQWGERTGRTVTFPTPFSGSQTYTVGGTLIRNTDTNHGWCYVYNKTNTGFYFHIGGDSEWFNWWAIGY